MQLDEYKKIYLEKLKNSIDIVYKSNKYDEL